MIIAESLTIDGRELVRHYSDAGLKIRQLETGVVYDDAIDVVPCRYAYEETDIPVESEPIEDSEALAIITGGEPIDA